MGPSLVVTLVHGTYAPGAEWIQKDSALSRRLSDSFGDRLVLKPFTWSGANSIFARLIASKDLVGHITRLQSKYPEARQLIIAHSHGGNVALGAASQLLDGHNLAGLACLGTPFFHARRRDTTLFNAINFQTAITGICSLCALAIGGFFHLNWIWIIGAVIVGAIIGALAAGYFLGTIDSFLGPAERASTAIQVTVPEDLDLVIIRAAADEASLSLAGAQCLSWVTSVLFDYFARHRYSIKGKQLRSGTTPKWLRWAWVAVVVSILFLWPLSTLDSILRNPPLALQVFWVVVFSATMVAMTTWFDNVLFGVAFLGLMLTNLLRVRWLGTIPTADFLKQTDDSQAASEKPVGVLGRLWIGLSLAMLIEVSTECAPPGSWLVQQLSSRRVLPDEKAGLAHSVYNDPRTHAILLEWVSMHLGMSANGALLTVQR